MSVKLKERYNIEPQNHSSKSLRKNNCNDRAQKHFLEIGRMICVGYPKSLFRNLEKGYIKKGCYIILSKVGRKYIIKKGCH